MIDKKLLKEADILLFHTKGLSPISLAIRSLTRSFWNHTGLIVIDIDKKFYVIEALGSGVKQTPLDKYIGNKSYILKVVRLKPEAFKDEEEYSEGLKIAVERMYEAVGAKRYDWASIIWLGIKYSIRAFWNKGVKYLPKNWNPFNNRYQVFCSELICECFHDTSSIIKNLFAGVYYPNAECSVITPHDISKSKNIR